MRKNRVIEQNRCYHLVSRLAHRAFFLDDEEKDRAVALMRRVEAGVKASMSYCINRTVSIYTLVYSVVAVSRQRRDDMNAIRIFVFAVLALAVQGSFAASKTWNGVLAEGETAALASVASNWLPEGVPTAGDDIVLDGTSVVNLTWDGATEGVPTTVKSWSQTADYTGVVTVPTLKESEFTTLTVLGNCVLMGGKWTHSEDLASSTGSKVGLFLTVGGNLETGSGFTFDAKGKGYMSCGGPSAGSVGDKAKYQNGIAHGGEGGWDFDQSTEGRYGTIYDSMTAPNDLGSSGKNQRGGGLVHLEVTGDFAHAGALTVQGAAGSDAAVVGTGGSVFISARTLTGAGSINACCGTSSDAAPGSGGGRIAIYARETAGYETFRSGFTGAISANSRQIAGTKNIKRRLYGGPGTIYIKTLSDDHGTLFLDNANTRHTTESYDEFSSAKVNSSETWELDRLYLARRGRLAIAGTVELPRPDAIISDGEVKNHIRFDGGSLIFTELSVGSDYPVSTYDLVVWEASEIPYAVNLSTNRLLRFLKPVKLTVNRLRVGDVKFAKGIYTTSEINERVGVDVAVNSLAASDDNSGLVEVLRNPLGMAIYVR